MKYFSTKNLTRALIPIALLAIAGFALLGNRNLTPSATASGFTGAIFTSTFDGTTPNANIFDHCCDGASNGVYLNGGPQNENASGLPPGDYYFQVTDPSGTTLLSTDNAVCRQVTVGANGRIDGAAAASGACAHTNGTPNPTNGSTPVDLCPFDATPNPGGEYKAWLIPVGAATVDADGKHLIFTNDNSKTDNFKCKSHGGEQPQTAIGGVKYYDLNTNGSLDPGEVGIAGWKITVSFTLPDGTSDTVSTFTNAAGEWALVFPAGTTYTACEVLPPNSNYVQTGPIPGATTGDGLATANAGKCWEGTVGVADTSDLDFFNVCLGPGGGLTLGFWSNKNGQAAIANCTGGTAGTLAFLSGLNLRNANGTNFDPTTYAAFRTWILNADATNMSYMLSAQLAAMELNVRCATASGGSLVFAGANPSGCSVPVNANGFISISSLMSDANTELGADGFTPAGDPNRTCQEFKKNALDAANNNQNFVQPTPCAFSTPY
jgi:hypothetical protein